MQQKNLSFPLEIFCSTKNKKIFCFASLAQVIKVQIGADVNLSFRDSSLIQGQSILFFWSVSLLISKTKTSI